MTRKLFIFLLVVIQFSTISLLAQQVKPKVQLNHIAIYVVNLKASENFYRTVVGLDTIPEPFHDGRHKWFEVGPKSHLHIIQGASEKISRNKNTHLCFSVSSIDDFINTLNSNKLEYENWAGEKMKVTLRVDGVKQIYFKDPDGYWIEINDAKE